MKSVKTHPSPLDSILQHLYNVLSDDTATRESLGPGLEDALGEADLLQREAKCEAQWEFLVEHVVLRHEVGKTLSDVVKQLTDEKQEVH